MEIALNPKEDGLVESTRNATVVKLSFLRHATSPNFTNEKRIQPLNDQIRRLMHVSGIKDIRQQKMVHVVET